MIKHLEENNETYFSHLKFAGLMGFSLFFRGAILIVHAILPMIEVPKIFQLKRTKELIDSWILHTELRKEK